MTFLQPALLFALVACLIGNGCTNQAAHDQGLCSAVRYKGPFSWPSKQYSSVVGYSFKSLALGDSMIRKEGGINQARLDELTETQQTLSSEQTDQLLGSALKSESLFPTMRCYSPHHVFVFYSPSKRPVAAIEVCFSCTDIRTWPALKEFHKTPWGIKCDIPAIARLCDQLALGLGSPEVTLPDYLKRIAKEQADNNRYKMDSETKRPAETRS